MFFFFCFKNAFPGMANPKKRLQNIHLDGAFKTFLKAPLRLPHDAVVIHI